MQHQILPSNGPYSMILKIVNNKPMLLIPTHTPHKIQTNTCHIPYMTMTQNVTVRTKDSISIIKNQKIDTAKLNRVVGPFSSGNQTTNGRSQSMEYSKQQTQQVFLSHSKLTKQSLIQQLTEIANSPRKSAIANTAPQQLSSFQWIETNSFYQDESDDNEDKLSQIVELTEEERQFFQHFIHESQTGKEEKQSQQPFTMLELAPKRQHHRTLSHTEENAPTNKKKVIRNFFRSKGSMIKDEKTCCNSQMFMEQMSRKGKQRSESASEEEQTESRLQI